MTLNLALIADRAGIRLRSLALTLLLALASGCSVLRPAQNNTRFYVLTAAPRLDTASGLARSNTVRYLVRVRPVELAAYLKTKQIVVRTGPNEIQFALLHHWAEPLDEGIRRVLCENLRNSPEVQAVLTDQSTRPAPASYSVSLQVLTCEGVRRQGQSLVQLDVAWQISNSNDSLARGEFRLKPSPWNGQDYGDLAHQLSHGFQDLAQLLCEKMAQAAAKPALH